MTDKERSKKANGKSKGNKKLPERKNAFSGNRTREHGSGLPTRKDAVGSRKSAKDHMRPSTPGKGARAKRSTTKKVDPDKLLQILNTLLHGYFIIINGVLVIGITILTGYYAYKTTSAQNAPLAATA